MPSFATVWKADGAAVPPFVKLLGVGLSRSRRSVRSVGRSRQWGRSVGRSVVRSVVWHNGPRCISAEGSESGCVCLWAAHEVTWSPQPHTEIGVSECAAWVSVESAPK